ncbi:MAG: ATP synthase subunit I [Candidatus Omnitrophica bacterium]|nr:ATP synthase subunit I [Candidatus Omnitrophota bacterium]
MNPSEPLEIQSYRRRITGMTWLVTGIAGAVFALVGMWHWTLGLILGLAIGMINFFLLCRQTARLANAAQDKAKGIMILGHWMRYLLIGSVVYLVYKKGSVSFPAFLIGMMLVYGVIFFDGIFASRARKGMES